jgi:hypothetical protein
MRWPRAAPAWEDGQGALWSKLREAVHEPLTWDPRASRYMRPDGSISPPEEPRNRPAERPRVVWRPALGAEGVELILARYDLRNLALQLRVSPGRAAGRLRLTSASGETLLAIELGGVPSPRTSATTIAVGDRLARSFRAVFNLAEGAAVLATLELDGRTHRSGPMTP